MVYGIPYGIDCNLTLGRLQDMYHGQPYARVDLNPMPESTLCPSQGLRIFPQMCRRLLSVFSISRKGNVLEEAHASFLSSYLASPSYVSLQADCTSYHREKKD
jgi:hypothetical protein